MKYHKDSLSVLICCLTVTTASAFVVNNNINNINSNRNRNSNSNSRSTTNKSNTELYDLSEWRDQFFEVPAEVTRFVAENEFAEEKDENITYDNSMNMNSEPMRETCVLPFPLNDVLLQGETKELCLYETRFHDLFEKSTKDHNSVVSMGLLAPPAGILQNMPLCEIENYRVMDGQTAFGTDFSILVTIRVVGRASLLYIQDENEEEDLEYLRGWCTEISDEYDDEEHEHVLRTGNRIADRLDQLFIEIQDMEDRLLELSASSLKTGGGSATADDSLVSEATMKRRILEAELEAEIGDDDEDDEDDDDDDDEDEGMNRKSRLQRAFKNAKAADFQGYKISSTNESTQPEGSSRSIQDLTALSWAYFSCENDPTEIIPYRLRAIESTDLCERMNLALSMMNERKTKLDKRLSDMSIDLSKDNDDDDETVME